jgi:hypothetical protein
MYGASIEIVPPDDVVALAAIEPEIVEETADGTDEIVEPKITEAQARICAEIGISHEQFLAAQAAFSPPVRAK